jgi:hypothetical protein
MKRIIITLVAGTAVLAAGPAVALARHHHGSHRSLHAKRHARIRHEKFGSTDPTTPASSPDNAGTVDTFSNGILTITLNDGSTVTGKVTDATELECTAASSTTGAERDSSGDGSGSGDDNGGTTTTTSSGSDDNSSTTSGDDDAAENQTEDNNDDQGENAQSCSTTSLTHGTVVREAELNVGSGGAVWDKVELITS